MLLTVSCFSSYPNEQKEALKSYFLIMLKTSQQSSLESEVKVLCVVSHSLSLLRQG